MRVEMKKSVGDMIMDIMVEGRSDQVIDVLSATGFCVEREPQMAIGEIEVSSIGDIVPRVVSARPTFKIIGRDNLARDTVSDIVWLEGVPCGETAEMVCERLNSRIDESDSSARHYVVRDASYMPYKWEP